DSGQESMCASTFRSVCQRRVPDPPAASAARSVTIENRTVVASRRRAPWRARGRHAVRVALSWGAGVLPGSRHALTFALILANGTVLDGSGREGVAGSVGVAGGRIAAIGELAGARAARTIDCAGKHVAPGFIDMHSHSDWV